MGLLIVEVPIVQAALIFDPFPSSIIANLELDGERYGSKVVRSTSQFAGKPTAGSL